MPESKKHRKISFKVLSEINAQADLFDMMLPQKWPGYEREIDEAKRKLPSIRVHPFNVLASFFVFEPEAKRLQQEGDRSGLPKVRNDSAYVSQIFKAVHSFSPD